MIVVIALPALHPGEGLPDEAIGSGAAVAREAAAAGARVELVGKVGDDAAGDAVVLALGRAGIGHAALLRDPAHPTPIASPPLTVASADGAADGDDMSLAAALGDDADEADEEAPSRGAGAGPWAAPALLPAEAEERPSLDAADVELALRYLADVQVVVVAEPLGRGAAAAAGEATAFAGAQLIVVVEAGRSAPAGLEVGTVLEAPTGDPDGRFAALVGCFAAGLDAGLGPDAAFSAAVEQAGWAPAPA